MNRKIMFFGIIVAALVIAGCATNPIAPKEGNFTFSESFNPGADLQLQSFTSEAELKAFLDQNQGGGNYYGGVMMRGAMMDVAAEGAMVKVADSLVAPTAAGGGSDDYSQTNNQVVGVDEGDIIKTDGEYIYTVSGDMLFIVQAYPGKDAKVVSSINLESGQASGLFIADDRLVVFGYLSDYSMFDKLDMPARTSMTFVDVYDIGKKDKPELVKEYLFEGNYFESRMIDGYVYVVTQEYPQYNPRPMPFFVDDGLVKDVAVSSIRYFPMPYDSVSFVTINAIGLNDLKTSSQTLAVESANELYMSGDNIYLAYTKYVNEWEIQQQVTVDVVTPLLSDADRSLIKKIEAVDSDVLSSSEKEQKVLTIAYQYINFLSVKEQDALQEKIDDKVTAKLEEFDYFEYTMISKVAVDGLKIETVALGKVPGSVNNQFSMDEFDKVLRIATTTSQRYVKGEWSQSQNHLYTLDKDLQVLDSIDDIAPGEQIYSARFMGERLYLVTFRQTDPFFVFDLSDPKDIKELGKLKIPGFSRYLHPYDEDHIIGIGQDASDSGRTQGLKISLFDVSDVTKPKEVASWVSDEQYSSSTAEYEHKAFLFDKEKELLVIPAYSYTWDNKGSYSGYNGALVFKITADDIELRGLIDHEKYAQNQWQAAVERSLYISDMLYTKSLGVIRINALDDLHAVKDVELEKVVEGIPKY